MMQKQNTLYDPLNTEICRYDGTHYCMNQPVVLNGKSISMATELSALTNVIKTTLKTTHIEFSDVGTSGATDLIITSSPTNFMSLNDGNCLNIDHFQTIPTMH